MKKKRVILLVCILFLAVMGVSHVYQLKMKRSPVGADFSSSIQASEQFYELFREALDSEEGGDAEKAIALFNKALPQARIGIEKGMVYHELIKIYRKNGDTKKELECLVLFPKYSMNKELIKEALVRADEIINRQKVPGVDAQ